MNIEFAIIGFVLFFVGFALGRLNLIQKTLSNLTGENVLNENNKRDGKITKFFNRNKNNTKNKPVPKINIDESKVVTKVETNSFKKDFDSLGNKTTTDENISSSVSKLSQLKKDKK